MRLISLKFVSAKASAAVPGENSNIPTGSISLTGSIPTATVDGPSFVTMVTGSLSLTGNAPQGSVESLNTSHALYANLIRSLAPDPRLPRLLDQVTDSFDDLPVQTLHTARSTAHGSGVAPVQGICTDGSHWYEINTNTLYKRDFTTGTEVASNLTPFTSLPAGIDHLGDGFVSGGLLYVPAVNWDGGTQTSTSQTIAVYNTSDLSLNTQFDVSGQTDFNGSGLCLSHSGTIYGTSFNSSATPNDAQRDIYEFNLSTGAYIATHTMDFYCIGTQGIEWDGHSYFLASYDTVNSATRIYQADVGLNKLSEIDPEGIGETAEIEGICYYDGTLYSHEISSIIREFDLQGLYIDPVNGEAVQFIDNATMPDAGTVVIRMTPHAFLDYYVIFDNKQTANDWEAWIYGTGEIGWRVNAAGRTGYNAGAADIERLYMFSWSKSGANVDIQLGVDGVIRDTATTAWITKPTEGLWLGGANAGNTLADYTFRDVVVYDIALDATQWTNLAADFEDIYYSPPEGNFSTLSTAALTLTGNNPSSTYTEDRNSTLSTAAITLTGNVPQATTGETNNSTLVSGSITLTGNLFNSVSTESHKSTMLSGSIPFTGNIPQGVSTEDKRSTLSTATITLTGNVPGSTTTEDNSSTLSAGSITLTGNVITATNSAGENSLVPSGAISITGNAPGATYTGHNTSSLSNGSISLIGSVPTFSNGSDHSSTLPSGSISFIGNVPQGTSTEDNYSDITSGTISVLGYAPQGTVDEDHVSNIPSGSIVMTGYPVPAPPLGWAEIVEFNMSIRTDYEIDGNITRIVTEDIEL